MREVHISSNPRQEKGSNNCIISVLLAIILRAQGQTFNYPPQLLNNFRSWLFLVLVFATLTPLGDLRLASKGLRLLAHFKPPVEAEAESGMITTTTSGLQEATSSGGENIGDILRVFLESPQGVYYEELVECLDDWFHSFWLSPPRGYPSQIRVLIDWYPWDPPLQQPQFN